MHEEAEFLSFIFYLANMTATSPNTSHMANAIRALAMDAVQKANSGHPGMPMGMAEIAVALCCCMRYCI